MKVHRSAVAAGCVAALALVGCGQRDAVSPVPLSGAPVVATATPAAVHLEAAPARIEQKVTQAPALLPAAFRQPASEAASAAVPHAASSQLLTVAMWAGIKSNLAPLPAEAFENSYDRWSAMAPLAHTAPGGQPGMPFPANVESRFTQGAGGERVLPL